MAPQRAKYYSYGNDDTCVDTMKFIEDAGVILDVRDMEKEPLSTDELGRLLGNLEINHFLNPLSESYSDNGLDHKNLPREEIFKLMAADYTLIRRPIIKASRLIMIGCDKRKIAEMLQIGENGEAPQIDGNRASGRGVNRDNRRGNGSRKSVAAPKG